ncbi:Steroid 5-alpha-reductase [Nymphaea thermarum]|nr:Steroid 5-alpha-reductase [Nymphaea thermarum]
MAAAGLLEARGVPMKYSKFWNVKDSLTGSSSASSSPGGVNISSRRAMLLCYTPAFLVAAASFTLTGNHPRSLLLSSALLLHFLKRILEVLFVHKYSGGMALNSASIISFGYATSTFWMVYCQSFAQGLSDPKIDLKFLGVLLFLLGVAGNFYHHDLLARLRKEGGGYKIPTGGLFPLVVCPHYLFEILGFVGIAFISQTIYGFSNALCTAMYLTGRSYATRKWYATKFEDFPTRVKALIPFVF